MIRDENIDVEEHTMEAAQRRPAGPRFGPFVTIAVAILLLFGAASRLGKAPEDGGWLNLDFLASRSLQQERLRQEEQRATTLITLGALPTREAPADEEVRSLRLREEVVLPQRVLHYAEAGDTSGSALRPPALSARVMTEENLPATAGDALAGRVHFDPAPEATPHPSATAADTYTVAKGDNWVKIGKHFGKKWQDIRKANPQANEGLRVGMKLRIP